MQFDVATAISQGQRDHQEDALVADFPLGAEFGFAVLADGMGGHQAGDVASRIVVTEVFSEIKIRSAEGPRFLASIPQVLTDAARAANECLRAHAEVEPSTRGMGATLVVPVFLRDRLFWLSIGDSPLYLFRKGELRQLNEDHSLAPQIDYMVRSGLIDAETANSHPDRNCLTSVLIGGDIARIDCPKRPFQISAGDIVIAASDGLQFLPKDRIAEILAANNKKGSHKIAQALLDGLEEIGHPEQDNAAISVIRVLRSRTRSARIRHAAAEEARAAQRVAAPPAAATPDRPAAAAPASPVPAPTHGPLGFIMRGLTHRGSAA